MFLFWSGRLIKRVCLVVCFLFFFKWKISNVGCHLPIWIIVRYEFYNGFVWPIFKGEIDQLSGEPFFFLIIELLNLNYLSREFSHQ